MDNKKVDDKARAELVAVIRARKLLSILECSKVLLLNERRYYRWIKPQEKKERIAWNNIMPEEETEILIAARDEKLQG